MTTLVKSPHEIAMDNDDRTEQKKFKRGAFMKMLIRKRRAAYAEGKYQEAVEINRKHGIDPKEYWRKKMPRFARSQLVGHTSNFNRPKHPISLAKIRGGDDSK